MDVVELLKHPKGETLEFKRDLSGPQGVLETIDSFATVAAASLLTGVDDGSGGVRGVAEPIKGEERVPDLIREL